jgi:hypothetical protein
MVNPNPSSLFTPRVETVMDGSDDSGDRTTAGHGEGARGGPSRPATTTISDRARVNRGEGMHFNVPVIRPPTPGEGARFYRQLPHTTMTLPRPPRLLMDDEDLHSGIGTAPTSPQVLQVGVDELFALMGKERKQAIPVDRPIMGGIDRSDPLKPMAYTRGKPLFDWSGVDNPPAGPPEPAHARPSIRNHADAQKGETLRKTGLATKFKRGDDFKLFADDVHGHFTRNGMEAPSYRPDPLNPRSMISVVKDHYRFTKQQVIDANNLIEPRFDAYDIHNDRIAKDFLLDSVDEALKKKVKQKAGSDGSFALHWMYLVQEIQPPSITRVDDLTDKIKGLKPSNYPGEDLDAMMTDFEKMAEELDGYGFFNYVLLTKVLNNVMTTTCMDEKFRHRMTQLGVALDAALITLGGVPLAN